MGKMKRFFSLMLVLTIVLGSFGSVFAAEDVAPVADTELKRLPKDVVGTDYEKAVARLMAFGVLDGYKDGTYRPEQDVTRAEFAKILVEALGIGNAAKAAVGKVTFKDVPASHWASGYVNVASGHGILIGFPDGTFRPEEQVTYAEALTMLVRALGYQDEFLKGVWPGSHIAKAAEAGITSGVKFEDARGFANRGRVAQMVNNTLDADVVKVKTYKDGTVEYEESEKTLLKDKLDISKYEDARVIADKIVDDGLAEDEITVLFTKDIDKDDDSVKKSYKAGEDKDFTFKKSVNPRVLIGQEVSVYMDDKDEVIYIESEDDDRAEIDYIVEIENDIEVSLAKLDKEYKFDKDAKVYVYNSSDDRYDLYDGDELQKKDKIEDLDLPGSVGKFVIKNNRVIFAEIFKSSEADPMLIVMENNKGELEGINKDVEDYKLDLVKDGTYDYALVYDMQGNKMDVEDIEKGNVVYAQFLDYDGDDVALVRVVTDNVIEGKIGRFREDRVEIDGKFKTAVKYNAGSGMVYDAYYTINTLEDIEQWNDSDWENDFDDAYDEDAVVYLDAVGRIAFLTTGAESTSGYKFGVVTRTYADGDRVRIFTSLDGKDGEDIVFRADKERDLANPKYLGYKDGESKDSNILGKAVKFRLNKNGEIDDGEFYVMNPRQVFAMDADFGKDSMRVVEVDASGDDIDKTKVTTTKTSFSVKDGVVIIDAEGLNPLDTKLTGTGDIEVKTNVDIDDFDAVTWKDVKDTKKDDEIRFYVFTRKNKPEEVEGMVFVGKAGASTASDKEAVYVRDRWRKGDEIIIEYITYGSDERKQATLDETYDINDVDRRSPYVIEKRSNGKYRLYKSDYQKGEDDKGVVKDNDVFFRFVEGKVETVTGSRITINNELHTNKTKQTYTIDSRAVVYEKGDKKSTSTIKEGDKVMMIVEDDIRVRVVQLKGKYDGSTSGGSGGEEQIKGKKVEAVFTFKNNTWITIEGVDYILPDELAKDNTIISGDEVDFEFREIDGDKVVTSIVKVSEKAEAAAIAKAEAAIAKLPAADKITLADKEAVEAARALVDKVKEENRDEIKGIEILTAAETKIAELEQEEKDNAALKAKLVEAKEAVEALEIVGGVTGADSLVRANTVKTAVEGLEKVDTNIMSVKVRETSVDTEEGVYEVTISAKENNKLQEVATVTLKLAE